MVVPASVPSDVQSFSPESPSSALKYKPPLNSVSDSGKDPKLAGSMSFTNTVPSSVPSVFHNSVEAGSPPSP